MGLKKSDFREKWVCMVINCDRGTFTFFIFFAIRTSQPANNIHKSNEYIVEIFLFTASVDSPRLL